MYVASYTFTGIEIDDCHCQVQALTTAKITIFPGRGKIDFAKPHNFLGKFKALWKSIPALTKVFPLSFLHAHVHWLALLNQLLLAFQYSVMYAVVLCKLHRSATTCRMQVTRNIRLWYTMIIKARRGDFFLTNFSNICLSINRVQMKKKLSQRIPFAAAVILEIPALCQLSAHTKIFPNKSNLNLKGQKFSLCFSQDS